MVEEGIDVFQIAKVEQVRLMCAKQYYHFCFACKNPIISQGTGRFLAISVEQI